jgi:large conductance mechanosensitive channel
MLIRSMNKLKREEVAPPAKPTTRDCPFCYSAIPLKASRCPNCTSEVKPA